jgi:prepilin-type N-terminal cleavage/methylation domain-containing protein
MGLFYGRGTGLEHFFFTLVAIMFFQKRTLRHKQSGFTILELMVVVAVMAIMTGILVSNRRGFNQSILLTNLAYDVAISIREAQVSGISVKGFTETLNSVTSTSFDRGYGIHFHEDSVGSTIIRYAVFVDGSNGQPTDKRLERTTRNPPDAGDETIIKPFVLGGGYWFSFCGHLRTQAQSTQYDVCSDFQASNSVIPNTSIEELNITFSRPDPDAYFVLEQRNAAGVLVSPPLDRTTMDKVRVTLHSPSGAMRHILIYSNGQVAVCQNQC